MAEKDTIQDINRYSALVIAVVLLTLAAWGLGINLDNYLTG
jgi:hypothetical protein